MPFFFFNFQYMLFMAPALLLVWWAQTRVKRAFAKWNKVRNQRNLRGADVAKHLLRSGNLIDVHLEGARPKHDHYDPRDNVLRLSPEIADTASVTALAVAAHEIGHALQDRDNYGPLRFRSALVPAVNIGSNLGWFFIIGGFVLAAWLGLSEFGVMVSWIGVAFFGLGTLFAFATLPVEFDASRRAMNLLTESGLILTEEERRGTKAVLDAAALTYVAALGAALSQLLYYVFLVSGMGRRR